MAFRWSVTLWCFALTIFMVAGYPKLPTSPSKFYERSSRDLDKTESLRIRLHRLLAQFHQLKADEESVKSDNEAGDDVVSALRDVSRRREGTEAAMTSERQKQVQMLAKGLSKDYHRDLHELADRLTRLLRESTPDRHGPVHANSAGEYLSGKYRGYKGSEAGREVSHHRVGNYGDDEVEKELKEGEEEEEEEEEDGEEEEEEEKRKELQGIYDSLLRLYERQKKEEGKDGKMKASNLDKTADRESLSRYRGADFDTSEGKFGDFVDADDDDDDEEEEEEEAHSSPTSQRSRHDMRNAVMEAIEKRLLNDVRDAKSVGVSVDDLIQDVQRKAVQAKDKRLRQIEEELDKLSRED